ncbi:hypothetical protein BGZ76_007135 [Entomortierella beljakovae]|nr:hypothetical protein BGZ76_007135 [Entomortierella beljakovae]
MTWEKRVSKKYYDRLYKEYALVELRYYKEGRVAMRWRNENELLRGKGEYTCGSLGCDEPKGLLSWEVNFGYMEQGEKKNALVKVRLCEQCSAKLNHKKKHKLIENSQDDVTHRNSRSYSDKKRKKMHSDEERNRSRERKSKRDDTEKSSKESRPKRESSSYQKSNFLGK